MIKDLFKVVGVMLATFIAAYGIAYLKQPKSGALETKPAAAAFTLEEITEQLAEKDAHLMEGWREFQSDSGQFSVEFPSYPQHVSEKYALADSGLILEYDVYVVEEEDGTIYMMSLIKYPEQVDTSDEQAILIGLKDEMLEANPTNELISLDGVEVAGCEAIEFAIENDEAFINSQALMAGKTLYLLSVIDRADQFVEKDYSHYTNSFELLNGE